MSQSAGEPLWDLFQSLFFFKESLEMIEFLRFSIYFFFKELHLAAKHCWLNLCMLGHKQN